MDQFRWRAALRYAPEILAAARVTGLDPTGIVGERRDRKYVNARWMAMRALRVNLGWSTTRIGKLFGGRDHSSILHGLNRLDELTSRDHRLKLQAAEVARRSMASRDPLAAKAIARGWL